MHRLGTPVVLVQYTVPVSRVPAVVMVHDLSFEDPRAGEWLPLRTRLRYRATIRASVRRAAHVLTVSEYSKSDIIRLYEVDPARVTVVPNAVDPRLANLLKATPEARGGQPTVLMVGNVLPRKNLPVVARAIRLMRDRGEDVVLRVVGSVHRTGRRDADQAIRLLGDAVTFTGYVTPEQLARELRSAHVLAFPSLFEGFGMPLLEAMFAGLPVAASDRTSLPEVAGEAALVVPAEDYCAWADAMSDLLAQGDARHIVQAGLDRQEAFRWEDAATVVSQLLTSIGSLSR